MKPMKTKFRIWSLISLDPVRWRASLRTGKQDRTPAAGFVASQAPPALAAAPPVQLARAIY